MIRLLKLHPHKHTGKLIHHKHTSYRALLLVFIVAGIAMVMMHRAAIASDMVVTAKVAAPIPSGAPVFTSPLNGLTLTDPLVTFTGTCPVITPPVSIVLYQDGVMIGSGACQADGTFSITATITEGTHTYTATVMTVTNDTGGTSAPLTLTYAPPAPVLPPAQQPSGSTQRRIPQVPTVAELNIVSEKPFIIYSKTANAVWRGYFTGGKPPYIAFIDWGDGFTEQHNVGDSSPQYYSHSYQKSGPYKVTIKLQDSEGRSIIREYATVNLLPFDNTVAPAGNIVSHVFSGESLPYNLYILYLLALLIMLVLWRREHLHHLRQSRRLVRVTAGQGKRPQARKRRGKY